MLVWQLNVEMRRNRIDVERPIQVVIFARFRASDNLAACIPNLIELAVLTEAKFRQNLLFFDGAAIGARAEKHSRNARAVGQARVEPLIQLAIDERID
jgi:hypothetical protein